MSLKSYVCLLLLAAGLCGCGGGAVSLPTTTTPVSTAKSIWVAAWADAPDSLGGVAGSEQTFREIVKPTVGSRGTVRLHFSNYFGTSPVTIGAVHVGVQGSGPAVKSDTVVTFNGATSMVVAAGSFATSDPVTLAFNYGDLLAVTEYVSGAWTKLNQHNQGTNLVTSYQTAIAAGNQTADLAGAAFTQTTYETYLLDRVEVYGGYKETIAALGGSTTDGLHSGLDQHSTYPEQLAAALHAAGRDDIAIANVGISGDTVLGTGATAGINRFSRDVLALPNVAGVIDYLGANDLRDSCVTAAAVIAGKQNLIAQAHAGAIKIFIGVTAPSTFCGAQNPSGFGTRFAQGSGEEVQRTLFNAWINSTLPMVANGVTVQPPGADGIVDFSAPLTDPANTSYMLPAYDSGDDIHPNATGYGLMAKAVSLSFF